MKKEKKKSFPKYFFKFEKRWNFQLNFITVTTATSVTNFINVTIVTSSFALPNVNNLTTAVPTAVTTVFTITTHYIDLHLDLKSYKEIQSVGPYM